MEVLLLAQVGESLRQDFIRWLPKLGMVVLILVAIFFGAAAIKQLIQRIGRSRNVDPDAINILVSSANVAIWTFGLITALGTLGVDVAALVAGLGLTGFALGFALKDIVSNAVAGILILIHEPFRRGDRIAVMAFDGQVKGINLRYTIIETEEKDVMVPNSTMFNSPVSIFRPTQPAPAEPRDSGT